MVTEVVVGGPVSNNKGINLPGVAMSVPAMSEKDSEDLRWALKQGVDMVALSFVRSADDILLVHKIMDEEGRRVPVIAKIEKPQAVDEPRRDRRRLRRDHGRPRRPRRGAAAGGGAARPEADRQPRPGAGKPVIIATQMLESMITSPRPTRAEASDVANAILDGADAVMLSGETSVGEFPVVTVQTMARIVDNVEQHGFSQITDVDWDPHTTSGVITKAATEVATRLGAKFLVTFTHSGDSARRLARLRSEIPILAFTPIEQTQAALTLTWGVETFLVPMVGHTDDMIRQVDLALTQSGKIAEGDRRDHRRRLAPRGRRPHEHDPRPPDRRAALTAWRTRHRDPSRPTSTVGREGYRASRASVGADLRLRPAGRCRRPTGSPSGRRRPCC